MGSILNTSVVFVKENATRMLQNGSVKKRVGETGSLSE
jgi:hypothetical protein